MKPILMSVLEGHVSMAIASTKSMVIVVSVMCHILESTALRSSTHAVPSNVRTEQHVNQTVLTAPSRVHASSVLLVTYARMISMSAVHLSTSARTEAVVKIPMVPTGVCARADTRAKTVKLTMTIANQVRPTSY